MVLILKSTPGNTILFHLAEINSLPHVYNVKLIRQTDRQTECPSQMSLFHKEGISSIGENGTE